ncbi:MAG TPA: DUF4350 domain-containing protein [Gammaproteobacteria bacterium]
MREATIVRLIVTGVLAILTAWTLYWFYTHFERASRETISGYSQEAQRNPLLAAERFLTRLGADTKSISVSELWRTPPQPGDVVLFHRFSYPRVPERQRQLHDWLAAGGHLIIDAAAVPDEEDKAGNELFAELGVKAVERDFEPDAAREQTLEIAFADFEDRVSVAMNSDRYLLDTEELATAGVPLGDGYGLLQYEVGDGYVTVLADNAFLENRQIGTGEHALALALLVGIEHEGRIWLVHDVAMPSLLALAWQHTSQALIAAMAAALLWLWSLGKRLGPQLPPAQAPRRDIGEHLTASAQYLWGLDHCMALLQQNRQRIEQAWLTKHYLLRTLPLHERSAWIAARSGLSASAVERALYDEHSAEGDFIEISSYLQLLRTAL